MGIGNMGNVSKLANEIISSKPKVNSPVIDQMKADMKEMISVFDEE